MGIVQRFGEHHSFSQKGIQKMKTTFVALFDKDNDGLISIDEFDRLYHSALETDSKKENFTRVVDLEIGYVS